MKGGLAAQCAVAMALRKAGAAAGRRPDRRVGGRRGVRGRRRDARRRGCAGPPPTPARSPSPRTRRCCRASRGGHFFDVVCRAGDPSAYFSKDEVVSPAVPMGRLLGWIDGWVERRRRVDRGAAYARLPRPRARAGAGRRGQPLRPRRPVERAPRGARAGLLPVPARTRTSRRASREIEASLRDFAAADPFFREHPLEVRAARRPAARGARARRPTTPGRAACTGRRSGGPRRRGAAHRLRVAVRRVPEPAALRHPDARSSARAGAGAHNADEYVETASVLRTAEVVPGRRARVVRGVSRSFATRPTAGREDRT